MKQKFYERIQFDGELSQISQTLCKDYGLGTFISNKIITTGYEDFNYVLETSSGKYVVKILEKQRTEIFANSYLKCMQKAIEIGVNHPKLYKSVQGFLHILKIKGLELMIFVLECIDGKDFYNLGIIPDEEELKIIAKQMTLVHQMDIKPEFSYDEWAIVNFRKEFEQKKCYLRKEDYELLKRLYQEFNKVKLEELQYCYVHGDIILTNVMKDTSNKIWIIDFAASNYYPRIVDLAVTICSLCLDESSKEISDIRAQIFLDEYQKNIKLAHIEIETLPLFIKIAHVMHILLGSYEKIEYNNDSKENEYWINHGRKGLMQMICKT